jgi:hypothetical protein
MNKTEEIWKTFKTTVWKKHSVYYQVSNLGNTRKITSDGEIRPLNQYLSGGQPNSRYYCLPLNECKYVHRLVAEMFIPNPANLKTVNHKDFNKINNNVENLEWASYLDQAHHKNSYKGLSKNYKELKINSKKLF